MGKIICNICMYQPETDTLNAITEHTIALHLYLPNQKLIHLLDNIRRYHLHGKTQLARFVYIAPRN